MNRFKLPKTLTLDYRKWICGIVFNETPKKECSHGKGSPELLNNEGYMCCLGQWSIQSGCKKQYILNFAQPDEVPYYIPTLTKKESSSLTNFSYKAIEINDDSKTTLAQKVIKLRSLVKKYRREIVLKNFPKKILKEIEELSR